VYEQLKAELIRVERLMLREFGFIVHVEHPHKLVLNHLHMMLGTAHHDLMQEAWSLTNDRFEFDSSHSKLLTVSTSSQLNLLLARVASPLMANTWAPQSEDDSLREVQERGGCLRHHLHGCSTPAGVRLQPVMSKIAAPSADVCVSHSMQA
jgi:hypothetical protein